MSGYDIESARRALSLYLSEQDARISELGKQVARLEAETVVDGIVNLCVWLLDNPHADIYAEVRKVLAHAALTAAQSERDDGAGFTCITTDEYATLRRDNERMEAERDLLAAMVQNWRESENEPDDELCNAHDAYLRDFTCPTCGAPRGVDGYVPEERPYGSGVVYEYMPCDDAFHAATLDTDTGEGL